MALFDVIVVGSGPAGVFAAYGLRGLKVLMLDVGHTAPPVRLPERNVQDVLASGESLFEELIGEGLEGLALAGGRPTSPKLKGPLMRFVTRRPREEAEDRSAGFDATLSYAKGGLANAWGAGVFRFTDRDLEGFPFRAGDLDPFYDALTRHIGINGAEDDLAPYFGSAKDLLPPLPLSPLAEDFLTRYRRRREALRSRSIHVGRMRGAVLTREHRGRAAYPFLAQDFFQPNIPGIYHPGYTLDEMLRAGEVDYLPGRLVTSFEESEGKVTVHAKDTSTGGLASYEGRRLVLAAGAVNSARICLASARDRRSRLPILDNPVTFIPFVRPRFIGAPAAVRHYPGAELNLVYDGPLSPAPVQASFYGLMAPMRSDLLFEMPLSVGGNLAAARYLLPAIGVLQVFHPDAGAPGNTLGLKEDGSLDIRYGAERDLAVERHLIGALRTMGYWSLERLCKVAPPGSSIHYTGTLPMREKPVRPFETDASGLLFGHRLVHIADAATFPSLPAKNLTFTIMANALRIAEKVQAGLKAA